MIPTDPDTIQTGLGYGILVGLALCALLALASGFFLISDINNPARHITTPAIVPSGPQILGPASTLPPASGVIVSEEYRTASFALWITAALTGSAVVAQLFFVSQRRHDFLADGED